MIQSDQIPQSIYQQVLKVLQILEEMRQEGLADSEAAIPALGRLHDQAIELTRLVRQA